GPTGRPTRPHQKEPLLPAHGAGAQPPPRPAPAAAAPATASTPAAAVLRVEAGEALVAAPAATALAVIEVRHPTGHGTEGVVGADTEAAGRTLTAVSQAERTGVARRRRPQRGQRGGRDRQTESHGGPLALGPRSARPSS